jgi:hypothetical protein
MVRTRRHRRRDLAILETRPYLDTDSRPSLDDPDAPDEGLRTEWPVPGVKPGDEVCDLDRPAFAMKNGFQDSRIGKVSLLGRFEAQKLDGKPAVARVAARASEELMKDGIAVESWKTTPNDARLLVHESADAAISN